MNFFEVEVLRTFSNLGTCRITSSVLAFRFFILAHDGEGEGTLATSLDAITRQRGVLFVTLFIGARKNSKKCLSFFQKNLLFICFFFFFFERKETSTSNFEVQKEGRRGL